MRCFERLVKSKFLANVSAELRLAQQTLKSMSQPLYEAKFHYDKRIRKRVYKDYLYYYYLVEEMKAEVSRLESPDSLMYVQTEHIIFIYTANKKQLQEALRYSYNINGDVPIHTAKHTIQGIKLYTALIDTRLQFNPISPN